MEDIRSSLQTTIKKVHACTLGTGTTFEKHQVTILVSTHVSFYYICYCFSITEKITTICSGQCYDWICAGNGLISVRVRTIIESCLAVIWGSYRNTLKLMGQAEIEVSHQLTEFEISMESDLLQQLTTIVDVSLIVMMLLLVSNLIMYL